MTGDGNCETVCGNSATFFRSYQSRFEKRHAKEATSDFPFSVTPHFAKLIVDRPDVPELVRVVLPTAQECQSFPGQLIDPTGEDEVTPAPGLKHMYPDRVRYTLTYVCPAYCRFCFRRRIVGSSQGLPYPEIRKGLEYIRRNPQIREVILSTSQLRKPLTHLLGLKELGRAILFEVVFPKHFMKGVEHGRAFLGQDLPHGRELPILGFARGGRLDPSHSRRTPASGEHRIPGTPPATPSA